MENIILHNLPGGLIEDLNMQLVVTVSQIRIFKRGYSALHIGYSGIIGSLKSYADKRIRHGIIEDRRRDLDTSRSRGYRIAALFILQNGIVIK